MVGFYIFIGIIAVDLTYLAWCAYKDSCRITKLEQIVRARANAVPQQDGEA